MYIDIYVESTIYCCFVVSKEFNEELPRAAVVVIQESISWIIESISWIKTTSPGFWQITDRSVIEDLNLLKNITMQWQGNIYNSWKLLVFGWTKFSKSIILAKLFYAFMNVMKICLEDFIVNLKRSFLQIYNIFLMACFLVCIYLLFDNLIIFVPDNCLYISYHI